MKHFYYVLIASISFAVTHSLEARSVNIISANELAGIVNVNANEMLQRAEINSASIAITYNGIKHIAHFGELTKGQSDTPSDNTIYEIGSGSKTF